MPFVDYVKDDSVFTPPEGTAVYKNPTSKEWQSITRNSSKMARMLTLMSGDIYAWEGDGALPRHGCKTIKHQRVSFLCFPERVRDYRESGRATDAQGSCSFVSLSTISGRFSRRQ